MGAWEQAVALVFQPYNIFVMLAASLPPEGAHCAPWGGPAPRNHQAIPCKSPHGNGTLRSL